MHFRKAEGSFLFVLDFELYQKFGVCVRRVFWTTFLVIRFRCSVLISAFEMKLMVGYVAVTDHIEHIDHIEQRICQRTLGTFVPHNTLSRNHNFVFTLN